ncbi:MAG: DUF2442 domain-containing protein [Magnetococcales bacterium]|nr:DUF2442 domain-containing protein [Magnetococcales bacterium]
MIGNYAESSKYRSVSPLGVTPKSPWSVVEVCVLPRYRLYVRFLDGVRGVVSLERLVFDQQAGVFAALRDEQLFSKVTIDYGAVTWPGEIDLAPDALHDEIEQNGEWIVS